LTHAGKDTRRHKRSREALGLSEQPLACFHGSSPLGTTLQHHTKDSDAFVSPRPRNQARGPN
jgi:hypothetical protein